MAAQAQEFDDVSPDDGRSSAGTVQEALAGLIGSDADGVLVVEGRPGGRVYLHEGAVVWADVPDLPATRADEGFAWTGGLSGEVARLRTLVDRVYLLCQSHVRAVRFEPGRAAPSGAPLAAVDADRLFAELDRRARAMDRMERHVDLVRDRVVLERRLYRSVQATMTADELDLVAAVNGRRTSLDLAVHLGRGVFATALEVARLTAAGVVSLRRSSTAEGPAEGQAGVVVDVRDPAPEPAQLPRAPEAPAPGVVVVTTARARPVPSAPEALPHLDDDLVGADFAGTEPRLFHRVLHALRGGDPARWAAPPDR